MRRVRVSSARRRDSSSLLETRIALNKRTLFPRFLLEIHATAFSAAMATLNMAAFYQRAGHVALSHRDVEMVVHCLRSRRGFLRRRPDAIASTCIGETARTSGEDEHPPDGANRIF